MYTNILIPTDGSDLSGKAVPSSAESCANQAVLTQAVIPPYVFLRRILPWFRRAQHRADRRRDHPDPARPTVTIPGVRV